MDTFKLLKLKSYFIHLVAGTLAVLFGAGIFQAILVEMLKEYDAGSKAAYICGLLASGAIVLMVYMNYFGPLTMSGVF